MICAESSHQRISFSSDLEQSDITPVEPPAALRRDTTLLDSSNSDFEFHISRNLDHESSPADEIFADGMILPFQVTAAATAPKRLYKYELPPIISAPSMSPCPPPPPPPLLPENPRKYTTGVNNNNGSGSNWVLEAEKASKSFWSFKRSASLNHDVKKRLLCSFPRLARSNSAGSVTNSKRAMLRGANKHSSRRHRISRAGANLSSPRVPPSSPSSLCCSVYQFRGHKGRSGGGGGSFQVIGATSPFVSGSIVSHSRDNKKKKTKN